MTPRLSQATLGELVALQGEKIFANKDSQLPYIGLEHIASGEPRLIGVADSASSVSVNSVFQKDDILFGKLRPNLRKSLRAAFPGYCSTDILVLRCVPGVTPAFAGHVFQWESIFDAATATAAGTKMPRTSWSDLKGLRIFAPDSVTEQLRIAAVLDTIDQSIAHTQAVIAKLKQIRIGLLHDLLTRGLDANGELRDPRAHPEQFKDSPFGRIPVGWVIDRIGPHAQRVTSGSRGWAAYYASEGAVFLRIGNLTREHINLRLDDLVKVSPPAGTEGERTRTQPQDILISITADLGIIGVIPDGFPEAYINQHVALVRPGPSLVARWTGRFLASGSAARQFQMLNDSGAKAGMNLRAVESLLIAVPSVDEQTEASRNLDELDEAILREEGSVAKITALKRGLASDLLTGRVRVPPDLLENPA